MYSAFKSHPHPPGAADSGVKLWPGCLDLDLCGALGEGVSATWMVQMCFGSFSRFFVCSLFLSLSRRDEVVSGVLWKMDVFSTVLCVAQVVVLLRVGVVRMVFGTICVSFVRKFRAVCCSRTWVRNFASLWSRSLTYICGGSARVWFGSCPCY